MALVPGVKGLIGALNHGLYRSTYGTSAAPLFRPPCPALPDWNCCLNVRRGGRHWDWALCPLYSCTSGILSSSVVHALPMTRERFRPVVARNSEGSCHKVSCRFICKCCCCASFKMSRVCQDGPLESARIIDDIREVFFVERCSLHRVEKANKGIARRTVVRVNGHKAAGPSPTKLACARPRRRGLGGVFRCRHGSA